MERSPSTSTTSKLTSGLTRATHLLLQLVALDLLHLLASLDLLLPHLLLLPLVDLLSVRVLDLLHPVLPVRLAVLAVTMALSLIDSLSAMRPWTLSITS